MMDHQRITLIVRNSNTPDLDWNYRTRGDARPLFLESVPVVKFALSSGELDIERIVLDRCAASDAFLDLLVMLPAGFQGDILLIGDSGGGFLSASGRGGDRVLYALKEADVRFYLETHDLVTGRALLRETA